MKLPTDRYILECIFRMYESSYPGPREDSGRPTNDPYIPIDIKSVATKLGCSPELLFGRLYYHLDARYRYKQDGGAMVSLFQLQVGDKRHAVQFPYLASILAGLNQEYRRQLLTWGISLAALVISVVSLSISILRY